MRRTIVRLGVAAALTLTLAGCGGNDTSSTASDQQTSASPSPSGSPSPPESPTPSASTSALPPGCEAPAKNVKYKDGSASFDVTAGPDAGGHYDLSLDRSMENAYAKSDREITGNWISDDKQAVLFIDIEGTDPCKPDAFTSIATQGSNGPTFVDSFHTGCDVQVTSLSAAGLQGTFDCQGLMPLSGGGKHPDTRDATGTFTLLP